MSAGPSFSPAIPSFRTAQLRLTTLPSSFAAGCFIKWGVQIGLDSWPEAYTGVLVVPYLKPRCLGGLAMFGSGVQKGKEEEGALS